MTATPISTQLHMSLGEAVRIMEERPSQISVLPVVNDQNGKCLGLLRLHDIYQPSSS
jgi:arabinose-5-phosphate isomerase